MTKWTPVFAMKKEDGAKHANNVFPPYFIFYPKISLFSFKFITGLGMLLTRSSGQGLYVHQGDLPPIANVTCGLRVKLSCTLVVYFFWKQRIRMPKIRWNPIIPQLCPPDQPFFFVSAVTRTLFKSRH